MPTGRYHRPPYEEALAAWKESLKQHGFSTDLEWILEENLCFERDPQAPAGVKLGYQVQFAPHPPDAAKVTYHHFAEMDARMVFYRLGESRGKSICIQLCDPWLEPKNESDGGEGHERRHHEPACETVSGCLHRWSSPGLPLPAGRRFGAMGVDRYIEKTVAGPAGDHQTTTQVRPIGQNDVPDRTPTAG